MPRFLKNTFFCFSWLALSEVLCLVLAFSFAILRPAWFSYLSLACGIAAHSLLMANCGTQIAQQHLIQQRQTQLPIPRWEPLIMALLTAIPYWLTLGMLFLWPNRTLPLNLFLLLNAPFIQLNRFIISGIEPFSALSTLQKGLLALPPLLTASAVFLGYCRHYFSALANERARHWR